MGGFRQFLILVPALAVLAGCGGGGGKTTGSLDRPPDTRNDPDTPQDPKTDGDNPSIINKRTDGLHFARTFKRGTEYMADGQTTAVVTGSDSGDASLAYGRMTLSQDDFGGLRADYYDGIAYKGRVGPPDFLFKDGHQVAGSEDAWSRTIRNSEAQWSLSLWNAGKGHRDGLTQNEHGQTFHKIVGYYMTAAGDSGNTSHRRGHAVIGNATSERDLKRQSRTASYEGYYFLNAFEKGARDLSNPNQIRGGVEIEADFNKMKVSGKSTDMEINTGGGFEKSNKGFTLQETDIYAYGDNNLYDGTIKSDLKSLNGGNYRGKFFGGNANETAGTLTGSDNNYVTEGFFTTVRKKKK